MLNQNIMKHHNNFDFLRFLFSFLVVVGHSMILGNKEEYRIEFLAAMPNYSVFAFFVISGFLIYASFDKLLNLKKYFINRAKRILPAYFAVVIFFAFFLFFLSDADVSEYFSASWLKYLAVNLVFLNFFQPCIDYIFTENYMCAVNGALWTIKVEVMFYLMIPVLYYCIKRFSLKAKNIILIVLYLLSVLYFNIMFSMGKEVLAKQLPGCLTYFTSGILLYLNLDFFRKHVWKFVIPALFIIILEKVVLHVTFLFPFALGTVIIAFAFSKVPLRNFAKYGDWSYGIYLVHFPVIQIFIQQGWYHQYGITGMLSSYIIVILAGIFIWNMIEKPFIRKKN
ncbi:MAG: acyltransferase [Bergeyella sp.]